MKSFATALMMSMALVLSCPAAWIIRLPSAAGGPTLIIDEDMEGTGTPAGWTDTGTPDWDYTFTVISGTESFDCDSGEHSDFTITDTDSLQMDVRMRFPTAIPGTATTSLFALRTSAGAAVCVARMDNTGQFFLFTDGSDSAAATDTLAADTDYYARLIWSEGSTCSIEINTTGTFDGAGDDFTSKTGGTTADATLFRLGTSGGDVIYDDVQVQ